MKKDNIKLIAVATHNTIFNNGICSKHTIIDNIKEIDRRRWLIAIGYLLNNLSIEYRNRLKYSLSKPYSPEIVSQFHKYLLYSKQGLLFLAKWVIAYGIEEDEILNTHIDERLIDRVITTQLMLADYLPSDDIYSVISYLFKNISINSKRNIKNDIARSYRIFTELSRIKDIYNENEYLNFYEEYRKKYNQTINDYLALLFPIAQLHIQDGCEKTPITNIERFSDNMKCKNAFLELIKSKAQSISKLEEWCKATINNSWDYSSFLTFPFIDLGDGWFLSIHEDFVINQYFEGLFYRIRGAYPDDNTDIIAFLGRPFEKYVEELSSNAINEAKNKIYKFIPEFKYGHENKDSSDSYILCGNKLLIVEAKSKRPVFTTYYENNDEKLLKEIEKLAVKPINQAIDAYKAIKSSDRSIKFDGIDEIYIISVTLLSVPKISEIQNYIDELIKDDLGNELKGYFNLNIEEYEYLCSLTKEDINLFDLIEEYSNKEKNSPLINFLNNKGYNNNNLDWLSNNFLKFAKEGQQTLFSE